MRLVVIGPPGAGKGTQSQRLLKYLGVPHISTGEILREAVNKRSREGILAETYILEGSLVPDPIIIDLVGQRLDENDCQRGCLLDGFPRTLGQAKALDTFLQEQGRPLNGVLELKVDENILVERLAERGRVDDEPNVVRQRLQTYRERTEPLLDYYRSRGVLHSVDGVGTEDEVFERIKATVGRLGQRAR
jgi:adenylate kinase